MKNKNQECVLIFIGVILLLSFEVCLMTVFCIPEAYVKNSEFLQEKELDIYLDAMTVNDLLYNYKEILKSNDLGEINFEFLTVRNDTYYIGLYQDIILFVTPFTIDDLTKDIIYQTGIIIDKESRNYDLALVYYKHLIEVNNEYIYDMDNLLEEIVAGDGITIDKNNGLLFANISDECEINFVIERKK